MAMAMAIGLMRGHQVTDMMIHSFSSFGGLFDNFGGAFAWGLLLGG